MIEKYLSSKYKIGGRGPDFYDCWGMTREARNTLFGKPMFPDFLHVPEDQRVQAMTKESARVIRMCDLKECQATQGAVATGWHGRLCVHIGIVVSIDGNLRILETDTPHGPALTGIRVFENRFTKVKYFND